MKVLVTGARGQIGTEVVQEGKRRGLDILATGREELDITVEENVTTYFQTEKPDIVINAAAYTAVDKAESEPDLAFAINRDAVAILARACAELDIPLLHISTDYVFDGKKQDAYTETDTPNPQCVYGKSKLEGEQAIESILAKHLILRVSWVFGANGNNFVKTMLRLAPERDELRVVNDQKGVPTWSVDIADTLLKLAEKYQKKKTLEWGLYHYTEDLALTWYDFAIETLSMAKLKGVIKSMPAVTPIPSQEYPTPAVRPENSVLNCEKIFEVFDISPPCWKTGLEQVIESWKAI